MSTLVRQAKRAMNRVYWYEKYQNDTLKAEVKYLEQAVREMVRLGQTLTALRAQLSKKAVVTAGSTLGSITLTIEGDEKLLEEMKRAKNKAFSLSKKFAETITY